MDSKKNVSAFLGGLIKDNPVFTMAMGICSVINSTLSMRTALATGAIVSVCMVIACMLISGLQRAIPDNVRIPCHILIITGCLTLFKFMVNAYFPNVESSLSPYFITAAASCLIIGRAEGFSVKHSIIASGLDALGVGIGYTVVLALVTMIREILGNGTLFGKAFLWGMVKPMDIFAMAPGVLFIMGCLCALVKFLTREKEDKE